MNLAVEQFLRERNREWARSERDKFHPEGIEVLPLDLSLEERTELEVYAGRMGVCLQKVIEDFLDAHFVVAATESYQSWASLGEKRLVPRNLVLLILKNNIYSESQVS